MVKPPLPCSAAAALALIATPLLAADSVERVRFAAGASAATISATVRGYDTADYLVGARAGQAMNVSLTRLSGSPYMVIRAPGADDNLFDGPAMEASFSARLPADGDYLIRVFMMRAMARRNERAGYTLRISVR